MICIVEYGLQQNKIHPIPLLHETTKKQNKLHKSLYISACCPLIFAAYTNDVVCVDLLIQKGANQYLEMSARIAACNGNLKIIETLLRAGANVRECYHESYHTYGRQSNTVRIFRAYVKIYGYDDE